jgi:hypothetical protein
MRIDPETYSRSFEGPPPRSSPRVVCLAEWLRAQCSAQALAKHRAGTAWFVAARAALNRRGRPVVLVLLRWTPSNLPTVFPVRWDGIPVVLRQPSGRRLDMREVVSNEAPSPRDDTTCRHAGKLLQFPGPEKRAAKEKP